MKYKYVYTNIIILALSIFLLSCDKDDPNVKQTATKDMAGEWWVTYQVETEPGVFEDVFGGYSKFMTYNTMSNTADSIWIDDLENFGPTKGKVASKLEDLSFSSAGFTSSYSYFDQDDEDEENPLFVQVVINNGKVLKGKGLSKSKVKTDSIYMEVEFDGDASTIYIISGHKRTGFTEDEFE